MTSADCKGEGAGWGTIAGVRLKILVLGADAQAETKTLARLLAFHHSVECASGGGLLGTLRAAAAAKRHAPDLVHAVGVAGAAKSAPTVAAGVGALFVQSLASADLEGKGRALALERARDASALVVAEGGDADRLRAAGITRDIYVVSLKADPGEERAVLEALEVIYGRLMAAHRPEVQARADGVVRIGGMRPKGER